MSDVARGRILLIALLLIAAGVFLSGIRWGLPSRQADAYLFGSHEAWNGQQLLALAPATEQTQHAADVDADPITDRSHLVLLNGSDAQRAEIVRRYRLFSYQPDEMQTLMALARMKPSQHDFDPRLYKYGGLWVYPVGAMLKLGSLLHLVTLKPDLTFYLDHPEAFGPFYVVARLWAAFWAIVGAAAVGWIVRRLSGSALAGLAGGLCYVFMPVTVTMAHVAKSHLPAAVLLLLAVIAAYRYVETGRRRWWIAAGVS